MVEEIIERLPGLSGGEIDRLEAGIQAERLRRGGVPDGASSRAADHPILTEVLEYRPHNDGYLQLELRRYIRKDGSSRERGPYWYFSYHEGGKRKKLYLGKTDNPAAKLAEKRSQ